MQALVRLSIYTTQQLVLEAAQRWLARPACGDSPAEARARRTSLRGLLLLLLRTAATGVLATVLDAAIEYRRRQLLQAGDDADAAAARAGALPLSRGGVAAWKARLLSAVDELERQAGHLGIQPGGRFAPAKPAGAAGAPAAKPAAAGAPAGGPDAADAAGAKGAAALAATVEQLRSLVARGDEVALGARVDALLDELLGPEDAGGGAGAAPPPADEAQCQICYDAAPSVAVAGCRHALCYGCARRLCEGADHAVPSCPFCRAEISAFECSAAPAAGCGRGQRVAALLAD